MISNEEIQRQLTQLGLDIDIHKRRLTELSDKATKLQVQLNESSMLVSTSTDLPNEIKLDLEYANGTIIHKLPHIFRKLVTLVTDLLPSTDNIVYLGSATKRFKKLFSYDLRLDTPTASRPLKLDASKDVISDQIALDSTNDVKNVLDETNGGTGSSSFTKGDILVATDSTTLVKLGVGTDNFVLIADAASTEGVKWNALLDLIATLGGASVTQVVLTGYGSTTVNYKDWAGSNQTVTCITSLSAKTLTTDRGVVTGVA